MNTSAPQPATGDTGTAVRAATFIAAGVIATQVGGKAVRDAVFLSTFDVSSLPAMVVAAAILSIAAALATTQLMTRRGPEGFMPGAFAVSGVLLLGEWALAETAPRLIAVVLFLHVASFGSVLISGFWSLVNERFDPRTARKSMGRIASGATLGGLVGGLLAERVGAMWNMMGMLLVVAIVHLACGYALRWLRLGTKGPTTTPKEDAESTGTLRLATRTLSRVTYLRNLALLVILATAATTLVDYAFKVEATKAYAAGEELLRFFALFYTGVAAATFVVQSLISQRALDRLGLAGTVGATPALVGAGSLVALLVPGLTPLLLLRALEGSLRSSLYRSGYELLFTPIPEHEKRATKSIIDVGCDRLGDVVGGGIVQLVIVVIPLLAVKFLLGLVILLTGAAVLITLRLHRGYVATLARSLEERAVALNLDDVTDRTTRDTLMHSTTALDISQFRATLQVPPPPEAMPGNDGPADVPATERIERAPATPADPLVAQVAELRSGDPVRVIRVLHAATPLPPELIGHVIPLLAWNLAAKDAGDALSACADRAAGQLADTLLSPEIDFAIRRRIPRILSHDSSPRTADALLAGLADRRFEVRYRCGLALARVVRKNDDIRLDGDRVYEAVLSEAKVGRGVWESRRLLDNVEEEERPEILDQVIRRRSTRSLDHVFTLLSLVLPADPLNIAYRGIHTDDAHLRGTALEYLESVLPGPVREVLWPYLEDERSDATGSRPQEEVLQELLQSNQSIVANLEELRRRIPEEPDS